MGIPALIILKPCSNFPEFTEIDRGPHCQDFLEVVQCNWVAGALQSPSSHSSHLPTPDNKPSKEKRRVYTYSMVYYSTFANIGDVLRLGPIKVSAAGD